MKPKTLILKTINSICDENGFCCIAYNDVEICVTIQIRSTLQYVAINRDYIIPYKCGQVAKPGDIILKFEDKIWCDVIQNLLQHKEIEK